MKQKRKLQPDIWADQETLTYLREMINEFRVYGHMKTGIEVGKRLFEIRSKKSYGFTAWCKRKLGLTDLKIKVFMLMYENPDIALESSTQAEFMRKAEPWNPRYKLIMQFKPKLPKYDSWDVTGLALFYWDNYRDFPQELKTSFGLIPDVVRFYESYLEFIKSHNGDPNFRSHLERLLEVKKLLIKKHD